MSMRNQAERRKKPVNLSIDAALLDEAKERGINLSSLLERALKAQRAQKWLEENAGAIAAYNQEIEDQGVWSESLRTW